jgi:hypothetical protein
LYVLVRFYKGSDFDDCPVEFILVEGDIECVIEVGGEVDSFSQAAIGGDFEILFLNDIGVFGAGSMIDLHSF